MFSLFLLPIHIGVLAMLVVAHARTMNVLAIICVALRLNIVCGRLAKAVTEDGGEIIFDGGFGIYA